MNKHDNIKFQKEDYADLSMIKIWYLWEKKLLTLVTFSLICRFPSRLYFVNCFSCQFLLGLKTFNNWWMYTVSGVSVHKLFVVNCLNAVNIPLADIYTIEN